MSEVALISKALASLFRQRKICGRKYKKKVDILNSGKCAQSIMHLDYCVTQVGGPWRNERLQEKDFEITAFCVI